MNLSVLHQHRLILLGVACAALVFVLSVIALLTYAVVEERRATTSRVTSIVREMNGYRVYWTGSETLNDIASYDVQVCEMPCAGWRDWKMSVRETSAWFGPDEGKHFGFRVRARDSTGYVEPWPAQASMTTKQVRDG